MWKIISGEDNSLFQTGNDIVVLYELESIQRNGFKNGAKLS